MGFTEKGRNKNNCIALCCWLNDQKLNPKYPLIKERLTIIGSLITLLVVIQIY